jgi:pimeloyl-ACP methyl ester carboxylesterase
MMIERERQGAGLLTGEFHCVRVGAGPRPIVVLPGITLDNEKPGRWAARAYAWAFRRLAAEHTLYIVQRRRGLHAGTGLQELAAEYASLLRAEWGSVPLLGLSTGGAIAQHLALDHPRLVDRLILVVSGARLSRRGMDICELWCWLAESAQWRRLRSELAAAAVDGKAAQRMARSVVSLTGDAAPSPVDAADFVTTIDAVRSHDTRAWLPTLAMPALVVGGAVDPFFPEASLRETARAIPDATVHVHADTGHGLPKRGGRRMQDEVLTFLAAR